MTNRITINGIPSSEKQLFVNKLDKLPVAVEKVETYSVGGRADNLHRPTAKYNDLKYTVKCIHIGNNTDDAVRYLTEAETEEIFELLNEVSKMLTAMMLKIKRK